MSLSSLISVVRARLGIVMVVLVLIVCVVLLIRQYVSPSLPSASVSDGSSARSQPPIISSTELEAQWKQSITSILTDYDKTSDARSARERVLALRVPAAEKDLHLALFMALNALTESRAEGATELMAARALFTSSTQP